MFIEFFLWKDFLIWFTEKYIYIYIYINNLPSLFNWVISFFFFYFFICRKKTKRLLLVLPNWTISIHESQLRGVRNTKFLSRRYTTKHNVKSSNGLLTWLTKHLCFSSLFCLKLLNLRFLFQFNDLHTKSTF